MKIWVSADIEKTDSGKLKFLARLVKYWKEHDIKITKVNPDIHLFLSGYEPIKNSINVLRLDGLHINNKQDYKNQNEKIWSSINKSQAVIYQNEFCKLAYESFFPKINKKYACILNGADPHEFLPRQPSPIFLANCKWRPHKRLKTIVDAFLLAQKEGMDADLVVTGKPDYKVKNKRIRYVGWQNSDQLTDLLSKSCASLHLSWLDWCPNAMVESLVANCPVLYSMCGGHPYLVKDPYSIGIKDCFWNFNPCDYYDPPSLNISEISAAMRYLSKNSVVSIDSSHLFISNIAKKYIDYFRTLLAV